MKDNYAEWKEWHAEKLVGIDEDGADIYRHYHYYSCSKCGKRSAIKSNYCPYCGADMRGEQE